MMDMRRVFLRYVIYTAVIVAGLLIAAVFTVNRPFLFGMAFGAVFSLFSLWTTYMQVSRFAKMTADKKPRFTFGTVSRILIVLAAVWIALNYPSLLDVTGVIIGLAVTYALLLIEPLFHVRRLNKEVDTPPSKEN
ncbi:ATP synthase subunit I [Salisediminibacterium halotolerans]|uniref:ATP synthase protein I n=1 Tax=Salisediminibacterium halotolerans TaxID=517425 RepID=A0A1H9QQD5_9BACI|nr:ATP synthase subunit I [Salisediminibacterium haloalkalitolerans]SER62672.1 ATP synthase protein I [Salisediminibacterium haloalkalitolerans]